MKKLNIFVAAMAVATVGLFNATAHGQLICVEPESELDFGCVAPGNSKEDCFTITAKGVAVDYFISITGDSGFSLETLPGGGLFAGEESDPIYVKYSPTNFGDAIPTILSIQVVDPLGADPVEIELFGTGGIPLNPIFLIENILLFFDASIEDGTLESTGPSGNRRYRALRNRIEAIDFLIQKGYFDQAYDLTCTAILRCDDDPSKKDFVQDGPNSGQDSARQELEDRLLSLKCLLAQ